MFLPKLKSILYFILFLIYMNLLLYIQNTQTNNFDKEIALNIGLANFTIFEVDIEEVIERLLNKSRNRVKWEMRHYNWSASGVIGLEDLLPEQGGKPLKTVIISPWRSGSTYLGYLLSSLPGVVYYHEPMANFKKSESHLRASGLTTALLLKNLLKCEYLNMSRIDSTKSDFNKTMPKPLYYQDSRMWWYCMESEEVCDDPTFREKFCNLFPFQVVKDVHVRLPFLEDIMEDKKLNLRVVLVARDPRAIVRSRGINDPDCKRALCIPSDVNLICEDLVNDHGAASRLLQRYPRRIKVLRFEDLVLNPVGTVRDLLQFLDLHLMQSALDFLQRQATLGNHTDDGWVTKHEAFGWKSDMDFKLIDNMQDVCKEAMDLWGYVPAYNWTHQHSNLFLPISSYEVK